MANFATAEQLNWLERLKLGSYMEDISKAAETLAKNYEETAAKRVIIANADRSMEEAEAILTTSGKMDGPNKETRAAQLVQLKKDDPMWAAAYEAKSAAERDIESLRGEREGAEARFKALQANIDGRIAILNFLAGTTIKSQ